MSISYGTEHSDIYETVYDLLNSYTNWTSSENPTVTASYIDGGQNFPQIVIDPAIINQDSVVFDKTSFREQTVNVIIHVYTSNTGGGSANIDRDKLSNDVCSILLDSKIEGLSFQNVSESQDTVNSGKVKVRLKSLSFSFKRL